MKVCRCASVSLLFFFGVFLPILSLAQESNVSLSASSSAVSDGQTPTVELLLPASDSAVKSLTFVEVHFAAPVQGVDAEDLIINGSPATNVTEVAEGAYVFNFAQPADGTVTVNWRAGHGITDLADPSKAFAGGSWVYRLDSNLLADKVFISEFMADNTGAYHDEDGDSSDWIELFNSGDTTASLNGWFLTDDTNNLAKWRFPDVAIAPRSYLVVFASEKNRTNATSRLHTNFKLSQDGEYLALVTPATNVLSEFAPAFPQQFPGVSYGRVDQESKTSGYFNLATPGGANTSGGPGFAPDVTFSQQSGTITNALDLALATGSTNAVIRYTLDGNLPVETSTLYTGPIRITNSTQVRARAFQNGLLPGQPKSETYVLLNANVVDFTSDLPVIVIHTLGKGIPSASRQTFAHISVYEPVDGLTTLTRPTLATRAAIKLRGSSTEGLPKSSFAVEFWDEFNNDKNLELLGMPSESDWVLYAPNQYDPVLIHNPFMHQLGRGLGRYSSRTRFVEVYISKSAGPISSSNYNGIYVLEEKIKIGKDRVNIDKLQPENLKAPEVTGGYLLKVDRLDPGDGGLSAAGAQMAYVDPKEPEIELPQRDPQEQYLKTFFANFSKALSASNWTDPNLGYAAYFDVDAAIDYHVLDTLSGNVDALVLSTYFYKPRNGKLTFGPQWDFDRALGSTDGRDTNPRAWQTGPFFSAAWWSRLFRDKDFWQKWIDRYQELRQDNLSLTNLHALIDQLADEVRQAQPRERARWKINLRGGSYQGEVNLMKNWVSNRVDFMDKQFVALPRLSHPGGKVSRGIELELSGPAIATLYYTLDGSDPRLPQGDISPAARIYSGPITVTDNVRVVVRANNPNQRQTGGPLVSSPWSGPVAATFSVTPPPLILTELMFHPAGNGSTNSDSAFEFIELKNVSDRDLDLAGYRLTNGIQFVFTGTNAVTRLSPGERVLIVKDRTAFMSRYPGAARIAGEFTGSLSNSGDRLTMVGPLQEPVFDFSYANDWQQAADGFGFSLVLADETTSPEQLGDPSRWRVSRNAGGSPGQADPSPISIPHVLVNELLTAPGDGDTDALELFNPSAAAVDISDWFLTDDPNAPKKFRLSGGVIPAGGYWVLKGFGSVSGPSFSFSKTGDTVYLLSADHAGNLTGWAHGFEFGAAEKGISFGRYDNSTGKESFVAQTRSTLGAANAEPLVGPLVISELMYDPPAGANDSNNTTDEFIELHNITAQPLPLFDSTHPTNTWRLRGGVDFDFPSNTTVPADGFLLLAGFDPQIESQALATFRARYGVDSSAVILGPWSGHLNNASDTVRLLKPTVLSAKSASESDSVSYVLVEEITYGSAGWTAGAQETGLSLTRREPSVFGDDPLNWIAALPSAGDFDSDGDGLPDRWEKANGLDPHSAIGANGSDGDPDGDGLTNLEEFRVGTLPNDGQDHLSLTSAPRSGNSVNLMFSMKPNHTYVLQYSDSLGGPWQTLRVMIAPPSGQASVVADTPAGKTRFYRLIAP